MSIWEIFAEWAQIESSRAAAEEARPIVVFMDDGWTEAQECGRLREARGLDSAGDRLLRGAVRGRHMAFVSNVTLGQTSDYAIWSGFRDAIAPGQRMRDAPPPSPPPRYLTAPVVIAPGQAREVTLGDEIPGWGRVREITATDIVVEQRVSEVEEERLRQSGKAVYQILEYRLPRADAGGQQQLSSRPAPRPSHQLKLPSR